MIRGRQWRNSEIERKEVKIGRTDCFGELFIVVAGNFGLGGQETARIPGAREPIQFG
jgi:hypothetical protein